MTVITFFIITYCTGCLSATRPSSRFCCWHIKAPNSLGPCCLADCLPYSSSYWSLQSSDKTLLAIVQPAECHLETSWKWAFSFIAPTLWNTFPKEIHKALSVECLIFSLKNQFLTKVCLDVWKYLSCSVADFLFYLWASN